MGIQVHVWNWRGRQSGWGWMLRGALTLALAFCGGVCIYACAGKLALKRELARTPRDPQTGIVRGAEALDLDPPTVNATDRPTTAVLLLHGFVGSRKDFNDLGERLAARGYHVRLARLPGHGTTPDDFARQTSDTLYAGALREFRDLKAHYAAVDVVGFSMGGSLATLLAAREDVHRLTLVAPYYGVAYRWFYLLPPETWNRLMSPLVSYVIKSERFVKINNRAAIKNLYCYHCVPTRGVATLVELGKQARQPETLARIKCPTLLLISEGDEASSPARAKGAFEQLGTTTKQAHWFTAKECNHHVLSDYSGEVAKQEIVAFLDGEKDVLNHE